MSFATSSLPVPLSPRTSTLTPRGATRSTRSSTCRMAEVCATMRRPPTSSTTRPRSTLFSSASRSLSVSRLSTWRSPSTSTPESDATACRNRRSSSENDDPVSPRVSLSRIAR